jgi:hypothetical protein
MVVAEMSGRVERAKRGEKVILALCPAKSQTAESRKRNLAGLLEFARDKVAEAKSRAQPEQTQSSEGSAGDCRGGA